MNAISLIESSALSSLDSESAYQAAFEAASELPQFNPVSDDNLGELVADDDDFAELCRLARAANGAPYEIRQQHIYALGAWIIRRAGERVDEAIDDYLRERLA
ncbi:hypothetical protein CCO03_08540 [Comamonas serinivorans]|uniref:Uncharacterized protein n=1 Tax=Comamonas serinivorans TaxID=1082851 RepID=A0A1Y0EMA4_9BURK|nr:hypothetical protein [Comamonas serinivorans]ARU04716.1 hypothetical protein CCO03_08540 [Comamonas serinivorans]